MNNFLVEMCVYSRKAGKFLGLSHLSEKMKVPHIGPVAICPLPVLNQWCRISLNALFEALNVMS
jgi:hypothetical protein